MRKNLYAGKKKLYPKEINKNVTYFLTHTAKGNNRKKTGKENEKITRAPTWNRTTI